MTSQYELDNTSINLFYSSVLNNIPNPNNVVTLLTFINFVLYTITFICDTTV